MHSSERLIKCPLLFSDLLHLRFVQLNQLLPHVLSASLTNPANLKEAAFLTSHQQLLETALLSGYFGNSNVLRQDECWESFTDVDVHLIIFKLFQEADRKASNALVNTNLLNWDSTAEIVQNQCHVFSNCQISERQVHHVKHFETLLIFVFDEFLWDLKYLADH